MIKLFWSRVPGKFVNKNTGAGIEVTVNGEVVYRGPKFTGTVGEWYETLIETMIDATNQMGEKQARVFVNRNIACILECSVLYKPSFNKSGLLGTISDRFDVFIDKNISRDTVLLTSNGKTAEVKILDINIVN